MLEWLQGLQTDGYACLVGKTDTGEVVGYTAIGQWRKRNGYRL